MRGSEVRILCYGDSNTWGYISGTNHNRYSKDERWTGILQKLLGNDYEIIEEGLNSRTLISNDERPGKEGKNGFEYLIPCLDTHDPLDLIILMLGTNELKSVYNKTVEEIGKLVEEYFVKVILNRKSQFLDTKSKLILVCPPLVNENTVCCKNKYEGATIKSKELNRIYQDIADQYNCSFISNKNLTTGIDGVHLDKESHSILAQRLYKNILNYNFENEKVLAKKESCFSDLETKRLKMRKVNTDDIVVLWDSFFNNYNEYMFYEYSKIESFEEFKHRTLNQINKYASGNYYSWAIVDKETNELIGNINLHHYDKKHNNIKLGYFIFKKYRNKGYAKESVNEIIRFAFEILKVHRIIAGTIASNDFSNKTLLSNGFIFEGTKKQDHKINGEYYDSCIFGLVNNLII